MYSLRWKTACIEGTRDAMAYCRKHFLNHTALMTIEVFLTNPKKYAVCYKFFTEACKQFTLIITCTQIDELSITL